MRARTASAHPRITTLAGRCIKPHPLEITMRTIRCQAGVRVSTRSAVNLVGRRQAALLVTLNLAAAALYLVHLGHGTGLGGYRIDLDVYRTGARVLLHGGDLYGRLPRLGDGHELPFTYPPFAALAFSPLTLLGYSAANWLLTAVTIVSIAASLWCFAVNTAAEAGARMRRLLPWALPAALLLEPIRSTLTYGQINALLMALVAFDCLTRAPRWPRGILVGIAAAVKLTPAVFLLFFLLRRDSRSAARAGLSFAACTGAGFALAPHDSLRYWTQIAYQPTRIGGIAYASNQSILGTLARLGLGNPARTWLWLALCLLVAALAVTGMRGVLKANQVTYALLLNAAAGLLISPISWSHHWVWAAPALLTCLSTTNPNRRRPPTFAVLALLTFAIAPHWLLPSGGGRELHWSWWQQAAGDSYALTGLAALTQAAIKKLLPRPKRRARWQHHTARNLDRYRPKPVTTLACRPAHNPGGPCAALTQLGDTSSHGVRPAGEGNPEVTGYQRTRRKADRPDTRSDRREP
jgi:alpha-1,2-mannosyltransferase